MERQTLQVNGIKIQRISEADAKGTSFIGMLEWKSYQELVTILGQPAKIEDKKTRVQWLIKAEDTILCIYDYRDFYYPIESLRKWHIGSDKSADEVASLINRMFFNQLF